MTITALIVFALLAGIIVPVVLAEIRRNGVARPRAVAPAAPKPRAEKSNLRLVVSKSDMDRELAALLADNARKPSERED